MEENTTSIETEKWSIGSIAVRFLFFVLFAVLLTHVGMRTFRDNSASEVSLRFVRNSETIKQITGGVLNVSSFKNGTRSNSSRQAMGTVYGKEDNLKITVLLTCGDGMSDSGSACTVTGARYNNNILLDPVSGLKDSGWHEIEVGFIEGLLLTYKN